MFSSMPSAFKLVEEMSRSYFIKSSIRFSFSNVSSIPFSLELCEDFLFERGFLPLLFCCNMQAMVAAGISVE